MTQSLLCLHLPWLSHLRVATACQKGQTACTLLSSNLGEESGPTDCCQALQFTLSKLNLTHWAFKKCPFHEKLGKDQFCDIYVICESFKKFRFNHTIKPKMIQILPFQTNHRPKLRFHQNPCLTWTLFAFRYSRWERFGGTSWGMWTRWEARTCRTQRSERWTESAWSRFQRVSWRKGDYTHTINRVKKTAITFGTTLMSNKAVTINSSLKVIYLNIKGSNMETCK